MINGDSLWHVIAIKLWANWSSFNKINGHMVPSVQGQGHSDPKMFCDTPPSKDASTH